MPKAANLAKMLVDGGALTFSIKAHETLTHKVDPDGWKGKAETYRQAIEAVLFQFSYSFHVALTSPVGQPTFDDKGAWHPNRS
ncbi:hypothetical protein AGMMS49942_17690 [Spirochaetia bacterium]|nr:hypothetical protein AGMMS49942_17690 [Spirochaetia bacterium]